MTRYVRAGAGGGELHSGPTVATARTVPQPTRPVEAPMTWCHVLGPMLRFCRSVFLTAAATAQLILLSGGLSTVCATPFDYPYPYQGPFTTTVPASWGLGTSTTS